MNNLLKYLRRGLAALIGGGALLFFIDVFGALPAQIHGIFHIQIVPALMAGSVAILLVMVLLTLLFGRIYCSVICPLGILQDVILRMKSWYLRIVKRRRVLKIKYQKPLNVIRYGVLTVVIVAFALGVNYPLLLLDPYSNFGRIAASLFAPVVVWGNNLLAKGLNEAGNYSLYNITELSTQWIVVLLSSVLLLVLAVMVWRRGRLWCNTMCPVGSALGLISRFSLFRISLGHDCNSCGLCVGACKATCIDSVAQKVDSSRCVTCFNCLDKCKKGGVKYAPTGWNRESNPKPVVTQRQTAVQIPSAISTPPPTKVTSQSDVVCGEVRGVEDFSRRRFLKGAAVAVAAFPATVLLGRGVSAAASDGGEYVAVDRRTKFPLPPGALSRDRFVRKCTGCQLCVIKCPTHVLQPALLENGMEGMMQPYMNFKVECFCNYECKVCSEVCPNRAIVPMSIEEKKLTRVGYAHFKQGDCIVFREQQDCGACAEHCPSQAVHMIAYKDGLTIPSVDPELCIGCGGCESICPVSPPAIFVQGVDVQSQAQRPSDDKLDVGEITDFGF